MNITMLRTLVLSVALAAASAFGQAPGIISHQGKVTVGGNSFTGTGYFKFALVDAGTTYYWRNDGSTETPPTAAVSLAVAKGIFSVNLGDTTVANMTTIPASVFANSAVYLRVWFNDGTNGSVRLSPDRRITSVGYALKATTADSATSAITVATPPGMVLIPAGSFTMGNSIGDSDITDATPIPVTVSAFYMDVNLVSSNQWRAIYNWATLVGGYTFTIANPGLGKAGDHPVQMVNWHDTVKWCNARSEQAGKTPVYYTDAGLTAVYKTGVVTVYANWAANGYRLPTEAEWEKAARGGLSGQRFPWGDTISQKLANYKGNTGFTYDLGPNGYNAIGSVGGIEPATSPVGSFAANGYGLNDMAGNVYAWCWDWYGTPYGQPTITNPTGPTGPESYRVLRGGYWDNNAGFTRCANRYAFYPGYVSPDIGFRCVRGL
jgi:formylglycine-generating enzyme required for sulfatase activity